MKKKLIFLFIGIVMLSCNESSTDPLLESINEFHQMWKSANIANYKFVQQRNCYCADSGIDVIIFVQNNNITNVTDTLGIKVSAELWQNYKTADQLFDILFAAKKQNVSQLLINFDSKYGYPTYIYVDPNLRVAYDEYGYISRNLIPQ